MVFLHYLIAFVLAYLLGSLLFDKIVIKINGFVLGADDENEQKQSSLDLLITGNKLLGAIVVIADGLKGFIAIAFAIILGAHGLLLVLVGFAAMLGHYKSVWFKFQGNKDFTAALGVYCALAIGVGVICAALYAAIIYKTRYTSLAAIASSIAATVLILIFGYGWAYTVGFAIIAAFTILVNKNDTRQS